MVNVDADKDEDLLINLVGSGGSYSSAETFVLQNNKGTYSVILNKSGASSQRFGSNAKRIIQGAIGVVAGQGDIEVSPIMCSARDNDFVVRLDNN